MKGRLKIKIKRTKLKKELNNTYGIDWQKTNKIKYNCLKGKQTIYSIVKKLDLKKENLNLVFVRYKSRITKDSYFEGFQYKKNDLTKFIIPDWKYSNILRPFYNKTNVLNALKQATFVHVFQVEPDALNEVKKEKLDEKLFYNDDLNFRVKIDGEIYINSQTLKNNINVMINGKKQRLDIGFSHGYISNRPGTIKDYTLAEFVDKSGYSLINHRNKLESRFAQKKRQTLADAIKNHEFDRKNDELFYSIIELKDIIARDLSRARNSHRIKQMARRLYDCAEFMEKYEEHETFIRNVFDDNVHRLRSYHSKQDVNEEIERFSNKIQEYREKILRGE